MKSCQANACAVTGDELRVYVPARLMGMLTAAVAEKLNFLPVAKDEPRRELDASELACFSLSFEGRRTRTRLPYAFPFLDLGLSNEYNRDANCLELVPCVDWLLLSRDVDRFVDLLGVHAAYTGVRRARLIPFERITGSLAGQSGRPGTSVKTDCPVTLRRSLQNYNDPIWSENKKSLLELPEEDWGRTGISNIVDFHPAYAPEIERRRTAPPRLILDLGCGLGQTARSLARRYPEAQVVGLDASPDALEVARAKFRLPNLEFRLFDISSPLEFPNQSADIILSINALMYARNQRDGAREVFRVLAPGGLVINACRMEDSHIFWDFPVGLAFPTVCQFHPPDWEPDAFARGLTSEVRPEPGLAGFLPDYFRAGVLPPFQWLIEQHRRELLEKTGGPGPYRSYMSHALITYQAPAREPGTNHHHKTAPPLVTDQLERVDNLVSELPSFPGKIQDAAIISWALAFGSLSLVPEAVDFLAACLPRSKDIIRTVFPEGMRGE